MKFKQMSPAKIIYINKLSNLEELEPLTELGNLPCQALLKTHIEEKEF